MLTRTSAREMLETDGILMTSVDTGWITDERPHPTKVRLAEEGFHAPLDLVDGAARVYDPIVRGEAGEDLLRRASSRTTSPVPGESNGVGWLAVAAHSAKAAKFQLRGKVAIVTGAARGIGLATAQELSRRGATVVVVDLDPDACPNRRRVALGRGPRPGRRRDRPGSDAAGRRRGRGSVRRRRRRRRQRRDRLPRRDLASDVGRGIRPGARRQPERGPPDRPRGAAGDRPPPWSCRGGRIRLRVPERGRRRALRDVEGRGRAVRPRPAGRARHSTEPARASPTSASSTPRWSSRRSTATPSSSRFQATLPKLLASACSRRRRLSGSSTASRSDAADHPAEALGRLLDVARDRQPPARRPHGQ